LRSRNTGIRLLYGMTKDRGGHYQAVTGCAIVHNTVVDAGKTGMLVGDSKGEDSGDRGVKTIAPYRNEFVNNIISGSSGDLLQVVDAPDNRIVGNLFDLRVNALVSFPGEKPIYRDPEFRNAAAGDFRLQPDSPARTAGERWPGVRSARVGAAAIPFEYGPE